MTYPESNDYHVARLALLVDAMTARSDSLEGLTKLAKLDFLLRYPVFLERMLAHRNLSWPLGTQPTQAERLAVESRMIRHKFGPWDHRYYPILGALIGRGLLVAAIGERAVTFSLTEEGRAFAQSLRATVEWHTMATRCDLLAKRFDKSGAQLKAMIYEELPDVVDRPYRASI